jgi:TolB-like protein
LLLLPDPCRRESRLQKIGKYAEILSRVGGLARLRGAVMQTAAKRAYHFEGFTLDLTRGCLCRSDDEIELRPKSFEMLRHLVENAGRLVTKDELAQVVWRNVIATDESLARCMSDIRLALGDSERRLIKTVPGRGYRLVAAVSMIAAHSAIINNHPPTNGVTDQPSGLPQPRAALPIPDKPSIAVLPFQNLSREVIGDYFSRGIVEDIVISLSGLDELFVISTGSTAGYRDELPDPRRVGRELGVRYVVGGSVSVSGKRLRVSCELCEAENGRNIWAERVQLKLGDIFDLQDDLVANFVAKIAPQIREVEIKRALRKRPEELTAYQPVAEVPH